jgi:hypothetical protein
MNYLATKLFWVLIAWAIALVLLSGCSNQGAFIFTHEEAIRAAAHGSRACYDVTKPARISGHYCLEYMGEEQ